MRRRSTRGDTIIELVLAFAIFSLAVISTLAIMNTGAAMAQRSLETTLVRQQMDGQAEMIRYIHDTNNPAWQSVIARLSDNIMPLNSPTCPTNNDLTDSGRRGFFVAHGASANTFSVIAANTPDYSEAITYARTDMTLNKAYGLWVQIARAENNSSTVLGKSINAYDVYIHGCWMSSGQNVPMTLGTIVRIYDK